MTLSATGQITILDLNDGLPAIYAVLSNDTHTVPTDVRGENGNYTGAETTLSVYIGGEDDSGNWTLDCVSSLNPEGIPVVVGVLDGKKFTVTSLTATVGTVTFTASKTGYDDLVKIFSISKTFQGQKATSYSLDFWPGTISKNKFTHTYFPNFVTAKGTSKLGDEAITALPGYFKIYEQSETAMSLNDYETAVLAGEILADDPHVISDIAFPYVLCYQSLGQEEEVVYTLTGVPKSVHVEWYEDANFTVMLDNETVPVVADGLDSLYASVWCPEGDKIRNQSGSLTIQADIYNGTETVIGSSYKWYILNAAATTTNMGDADGGNGWQLLTGTNSNGTSGYLSATLTVPGTSVQQNAHFKCICFYNDIKLSDTVSVSDISDVVACYLDGLGTFKNGQGTSTIRARLMRNTEELDPNGTVYDYTWSIYDTTNTLTAFSETGKSITVNAAAISSRANLHCAVTKKIV